MATIRLTGKVRLQDAPVIGIGYCNRGYDDDDDAVINPLGDETDRWRDAAGHDDGGEVIIMAGGETNMRKKDGDEHEGDGAVISMTPQEATDGEGNDLPDGGWGWVVVAATFVIMNLCLVLENSFGVLFSGFLLEIEASSITVAWIHGAINLFACISSLIFGPLVAEFGWRSITVITGLLYSFGIGISAFATSAWFLIFSCSILGGLGNCVMPMTCYLIIPHYFTRRVVLANGITSAGVCTSQMIAPLLITYLQGEYGFRGATLIIGAIMLHSCAAAVLLHPVEWHQKTSSHKHTTHKAKTKTVDSLATTKTSAGLWRLRRMTKTAMDNVRLLKSFRVIILCFTTCFTFSTYYLLWMMVPFEIKESGYTEEDSSWCISVAGFSNLLSRFVLILFSRWSKFSLRGFSMAGTTILLIGIVVFSWVKSLVWKMISLSMCGFGGGIVLAISNLVMVEYMGVDKLLSIISLFFILNGIWMPINGPLIGLVRDLTGSYAISVSTTAIAPFASLVLWLLMPAAVAFDKRREAKQQKEQQQQQ